MAIGLLPPTNSDSQQEDTPSSSHAMEGISSLRHETLRLLKRASKVVMKRRGVAKHGRIKELYDQLLSLRSVVPHSNPARRPCVISDALEYKEKLKQQLQQLKCTTLAAVDCEVDVIAEDRGLSIRVSCEKMPNLLSALMEEIEELGLVYEKVNVSCGRSLGIQAFGTWKQGRWIEADEVKRALMQTIQQICGKSKLITLDRY